MALSRAQRYLLTVEYVGSSFFGFQRQPDVPTVQGALEEALRRLTGSSPAPTPSASAAAAEAAATGSGAAAEICTAAVAGDGRSAAAAAAAAAVAGASDPDTSASPGLLEVVGSSRTDTGVHALGNTCHVDILRTNKRNPDKHAEPFSPEQLQRAINHFLNVASANASVVRVQMVNSSFHSRFLARERTYCYRIMATPTKSAAAPSVFERGKVWHVPKLLDIQAMREACTVLEGRHDFSSFRASGCQAKSPVRTLSELSVHEVVGPLDFDRLPTSTPLQSAPLVRGTESQALRCTEPDAQPQREPRSGNQGEEGVGATGSRDEGEDERPSKQRRLQNGDATLDKSVAEKPKEVKSMGEEQQGHERIRTQHLVVRARAPSFLYHQVRLMVGTLKAVGCGTMSVEDVKRLLDKRNICHTPAMAPAHGLYLVNVKYGDEDLTTDPPPAANRANTHTS